MNRMPLLFLGIFLTFASAWAGLVAYPYLKLGRLLPITDEETGQILPPPISGLAEAGQQVYAANGCLYCHSQQVRPAYLSTDIAKGLGPRRTVARDYIRERPVFLGTMRTGPDLSNVGNRYTEDWQHRHLYEPAVVSKGSTMPAFRYLYRMQKIEGTPSEDAVQDLRGPHAPPPGYEVVPTEDAKALVAYLLSLKRDYPLPEAPEEEIP
jgi:cytochrome c oxidase cbb3-type subunit II